MQTWQPGTVFMNHIDKHGNGYVERHACWNTALFIESQDKAARDAGGKVEIVDEAAYRAAKQS